MDGKDLKKYRIQSGMTLQEVANQVHIASNTLINYENGVIIPNIQIYEKILNVFGYRLGTLDLDVIKKEIPDMTGYYKKRDHKIGNDMVLEHGPAYTDSEEYLQFMKESVDKSEISSIWEGNFVTFKGGDIIFSHNGILSKQGMIYVRQYIKTSETFVVKKAIFNNQKLVELTDDWATLDDVLDNFYQYIKYRKETEIMIGGYLNIESYEMILTDLGKQLLDEHIFKKHL